MPRSKDPALPAPASIGAVAERAGVSIATVSRVINGVANKASAETALRVREAIETLGYRPMDAGRILRQGKSRLVAVLAANLSNPAMAAIAAGAEWALRRAGFVMVLADTHDRAELQDEYLLAMRAQYASGVVLLGAVKSKVLEAMTDRHETPLVFVNRRNPHGRGAYVGIDNRAAGAQVARWFAAHGLDKVALIHGRLSSSATAERVEAFVAEARRLKLTLPAARIVAGESADHLDIGYAGMKRLLARRIPGQAVFCTSDLIAYGAHRCAEEVKAKFTYVGFDDGPLNDWLAPWLNAVRVPYGEYGSAIVRALTDGSSARGGTTLSHEFIVRSAPGHEVPPQDS